MTRIKVLLIPFNPSGPVSVQSVSVLGLMMKGGGEVLGSGSNALTVKRRRTGANHPQPPPPRVTFAEMIAMPGDQMAGLGAIERRMPSFEEMMTPVVEDMDPESCINPEYRRKAQDVVYAWKASRMLCKSQLSVYMEVERNDIEEAMCQIMPDLGIKVRPRGRSLGAHPSSLNPHLTWFRTIYR